MGGARSFLRGIADKPLEYGAFLLAVVAIFYAIKQRKDADATLRMSTSLSESAEKTLVGLDRAVTTLSRLAGQIPTRYVGKFPDNLRPIIDLLKTAQSEIVVVADFAGYSSYSDPGAFRDYFNAVDAAIRSNPQLSVQLYVYDAVQHQRLLQLSLPRATYPDDRFTQPTEERLKAFVARMASRQTHIRTYDDFIEALMKDEELAFQQFVALEHCDCFQLRKAVPMFLWMVDGQECIFAFENERDRKKNYFSFQTRDARLIEYFTEYVNSLRAKANPHSGPNVDDVSEMNRLVPEMGECIKLDGALVPCGYHKERLNVVHYEQVNDGGEQESGDVDIELKPTKELLELFRKMNSASMPAGHWGLMVKEREWLSDRISASASAKASSEPSSSLSILQVGTAGPIHYWGTAKVIVEGLRKANTGTACAASLHTVDRCLTPVLAVRSLLTAIALRSPQSPPPTVDQTRLEISGSVVELDRSFLLTGAFDLEAMRPLRHEIWLGDICDERYKEPKSKHDIVLAHFTFSTWAGLTKSISTMGYRNIAKSLRQGGRFLVALSDFHNPAEASIEAYHQYFADVGLRVLSATRVWDVYDLSARERKKFLTSTTPTLIRRRAVLAEYIKD